MVDRRAQTDDKTATNAFHQVANLLTRGGDARIVIDPATGLNQYFSSPQPSGAIAYASSTANDISAPAFAHLCTRFGDDPETLLGTHAAYGAALEALRRRIRAAYGLDHDIEIVFAPSGTDLEYVGLALCKGRAPGGIRNVLLGADEVGSGCIYSARAQYFAAETARGIAVAKGDPIGGQLPGTVELANVPVRDEAGRACSADEIAARTAALAEDAAAARRHTLVHVVHGSKTGLVLPAFAHLDTLAARHGDGVSFIVDACQARITSAAVQGYLARGCAVLITGSKFMGGPPFSGFALVPRAAMERAAPLPSGFQAIFRRAEWPDRWPGAGALAEEANPGLLLRLEASVFELERFQALSIERVSRVILAFHGAVRTAFVEGLGARRMAPYAPGERAEGDAHPIEMRTLSTLDLTGLPGGPDFDQSRHWHRALVAEGVRLGQPVKCVRLADGRWGGTMRVGLSMPQVTAFDALDDASLHTRLANDMAAVTAALTRVMKAAG